MDGNRWAPYLAVFDSRSEIRCNSYSVTGGLGASSESLSRFLRGTVRERIPVAGYDRRAAVFFKVLREKMFILSSHFLLLTFFDFDNQKS